LNLTASLNGISTPKNATKTSKMGVLKRFLAPNKSPLIYSVFREKSI